MEFPAFSLATVLLLAIVAYGTCKESTQLNSLRSQIASTSGDSGHHQTQKRSALLEPEEAEALVDQELYPGVYLEPSDINDLDKRSSLFRFGKRGSLFRFGKRSSLFRFGKRGGSLFRFGKRSDSDRDDKRTLFRFGKRSDMADLLMRLSQYQPYDVIDDVDVKRGVDGFHWGQEK